ncbi:MULTISPECIES: nuclear transport factor 2 family protein [Sphingomonas]|uniref:nuclear transport factor 2 family protein n=1 Tax=Sphingomonas TaxID=13687 RepID=UPI00083412F3|nr:nuclear transport factor 2 family protein [Sphingomonas sp. CCH10-B3]
MDGSILTVLNGYAQAWSGGNLAEIMAAYHDDFVLHYFGDNGLAGTHAGKATALGVLGDFSRRTNRKLVEIVSVMAGDTRGAIIAREQLGPDDARIEVERVLVYRVADGKLAECWVYDADQAAIDRLIDGS